MKKQPVQRHLLRLLVVSLFIMVVGGGIGIVYHWQKGPVPGKALSNVTNGNVVGPPSLPAAYVDAIFQRLGSPMVGTGKAVEQAAREANIDDAFALAVWWTETNDGAAGVGRADRNPGSVRGSIGYPSAYDGYTIYPSYTEAIGYWFSMLNRNYISRGLTTVYAISHPYVGTSTSGLWAGKVVALMQRYQVGAPAPKPRTPAQIPHPTVAPDFARQQKAASRDNHVIYPVTPGITRSQQVESPVGLVDAAKLAVIFTALVLALALAVRSRKKNAQHATSAKIAVLLANDLRGQLRANYQQPASAFTTLTGGLSRTTEDLTPLPRTTEGLVAFDGTPFPVEAPGTENAEREFQWSAPQTQPLAPTYAGNAQQWPSYQVARRSAGPGLPSQQRPGAASSSLRRTRLTASYNPGQPQEQFARSSGVNSGRTNGLLSRYREAQQEPQSVPQQDFWRRGA